MAWEKSGVSMAALLLVSEINASPMGINAWSWRLGDKVEEVGTFISLIWTHNKLEHHRRLPQKHYKNKHQTYFENDRIKFS